MNRGSHGPIRSFFVPHPVRLLAVALAVASLGLAACGGDGADESDGISTPAESGEEIVIETHITFPRDGPPTGEVLDESSVGGSPLCPGGTFTDQQAGGEWFVEKSIECDDGSLEIGFSPGEPSKRTQKGPWEVLSGTGSYEGLRASGEMITTFVGETEGRETFTGTVGP
jgi:hypothetical protein